MIGGWEREFIDSFLVKDVVWGYGLIFGWMNVWVGVWVSRIGSSLKNVVLCSGWIRFLEIFEIVVKGCVFCFVFGRKENEKMYWGESKIGSCI